MTLARLALAAVVPMILTACAASVPTGTWRADAAAGNCPVPEITFYRDSISVMGFNAPVDYRSVGGETEVIEPNLGMTLMRVRREDGGLRVGLSGLPGLVSGLGGGAAGGSCLYRRW